MEGWEDSNDLFDSISYISLFKKEFNKTKSRFIQFKEDFDSFVRFQLGQMKDARDKLQVEGLIHLKNHNIKGSLYFYIYKIKNIYITGEGAKNKVRMVFCYDENDNKLIFIEMYFKGRDDAHSKNRVKNFIKKHKAGDDYYYITDS